jgi:hypothetical protein
MPSRLPMRCARKGSLRADANGSNGPVVWNEIQDAARSSKSPLSDLTEAEWSCVRKDQDEIRTKRNRRVRIATAK